MAVPDKMGNDKKGASGTPENQSRLDVNMSDKKAVQAAHEQAEHDMEDDPELSMHSPNDDLDEGEMARLGSDENSLV